MELVIGQAGLAYRKDAAQILRTAPHRTNLRCCEITQAELGKPRENSPGNAVDRFREGG